MKFKIIAEDKKRIVVIPLSAREIGALSDLGFMLEEGMWKLFKLNKIDKEMKSPSRYHRGIRDQPTFPRPVSESGVSGYRYEAKRGFPNCCCP